jgi:two-component system sporulation sensor kinase A
MELNIMQQSRELSISFIENNPDPILLLDLEGTIVLANHAFSRILGWQKDNLEGINIFSCPSIPPHLIDQMKDYHHSVVTATYNSDSLNESNLSTLETIRVSNDGKAYHMMLSITSIFDQDGKVSNWAVHLRDVTAQKEAEQKLLRAGKLLAAGQIAAGITHEIRNPLTSLKGLLQLMSTEDRYNHDYLAVMVDEVNQIETFVDEISLLAMPKATSYKMTDITQLLQSVITLLETQAMMNNVTIEFEHDQLPSIWCNQEGLEKAFFNIIQNGIEAMPTGGTLYVSMKSYGESISIKVIDHGVGISEERIPKLGEPFYSNKEKGIGIGLMLTYKIIEQHNWQINVQSQVSRGTQITISLPISNRKPAFTEVTMEKN